MTMADSEPSGLLAQFGFEFNAGLSSLREEVRRMRRDMANRARYETPRYARQTLYGAAGSNAYPAAGNLVMTCDGPQQGRLWDIRQIVVSGPTITTALPGTAYVFTQSSQPSDMSSAFCRDFSLTPFPVKGLYGNGQLRMASPMNIWVVITGGTPGASYSVYADIQDWPDTASMATIEAL